MVAALSWLMSSGTKLRHGSMAVEVRFSPAERSPCNCPLRACGASAEQLAHWENGTLAGSHPAANHRLGVSGLGLHSLQFQVVSTSSGGYIGASGSSSLAVCGEQ